MPGPAGCGWLNHAHVEQANNISRLRSDYETDQIWLLCDTAHTGCSLFPGAPTAEPGNASIHGMTTKTPARTRSRPSSLLLYGLALCLLLLSPVLGIVAAAVAAWQAIIAGSIWYMPLGLLLVLAAIAMMQRHKLFDLATLGLVFLAVIAWFRVGSLQQDRLLNAIQALASQTGLIAGLLVAMILALVLIHAARRGGRW